MKGLRLILKFLFVGILLWTACTSMAYRFINPSKTDVEAFLHIPKSFVLDIWEAQS